MHELISHWSRVEEELGYSLRDHFLMPVRTLDNPRSLAPMVLRSGGRRWGLFQGVERGNVEALDLPRDLQVAYCRPYVTFDTIDTDRKMPRNLAELLQNLVGGDQEELSIDPRLPASLAEELAPHFRLRPWEELNPGPVEVRAIPRGRVAERLARGRPEAAAAASRLLARSTAREELAPYLEPRPDHRFVALDDLLARGGLSAVLVSSPVNVQELAGVPLAAERRPLAALYEAEGPAVYLVERAVGGPGRRFSSLRTALAELLPEGALGVEMEDLPAGLFRGHGLEERRTAPADLLLREWRDRAAGLDLAYYVIAGRASAFAIEGALGWADSAVREGRSIAERDVDAVYFQDLGDFVARTGLPLRVTRFMTNHHCGARTLYPSSPTGYPVDESANTLKIDAGCLLFDEEGHLHGCSDLARTLAFSEEGREMYRILEAGVRRVMVPAARAGEVAEEVFDRGIDAVWERCRSLGSRRLVPKVPSLAGVYRRDVGHLLGKNDLAHLSFREGDRGRLAEGMVACLEYQWPIRGHSLAVEDICLVTPRGGINFTWDPT